MINFTLDQNLTGLSVSRWQPESITINGKEHDFSVILTPQQVVEWPLSSCEELDQERIKQLEEFPADVIIIGTGSKQIFPDIALLAPFYQQGIGVEIMDSYAACRTFNVLAAENRRPVAGIIVEKS